MTTFSDFGLSNEIVKALSNMGFEEPTPIQAQAIPIGMQGKDMIGQAQTGTGKTTAFGVPLLEQIDLNEGIQGLVLAPTRELAVQVAEELNRIGQVKGVRTLPVYGGQDINRQIRALKKHPHIIAATPGRLIDHIERKTIRLSNIKMVVLDEADEMLNMGFIEDIERILSEIKGERQTLLFSATMPRRIQSLAEKFMQEPEMVKVKAKEMTVKNIEQYYMEVHEKQKFDVLCNLLDIQSPELAIVFGRTKKRVDEVVEGLIKRGYSAEGIHGDIPQAKRDQVIRRFKEQTIDIMVATDVAARGLDISGVSHVYNFDIPQDPESYVHRIGRTGRAGNKGLAITFVSPREIDHLKIIESVTKSKMAKKPVPSFKDVVAGNQQATINKLMEVIEKEEHADFKRVAENLLEDTDSVTLLAAAFKLLTKGPDVTPVKLTAVEPIRVRKPKGDRGGRRFSDRSRGSGRDRRDFKGGRDRRSSKPRSNSNKG
ncbi:MULTISPECIES: DEAD/DEAH box helicase [Cytobacillus]|uniref:ATP-dependent RNA helicase CshA n=1 Tax=Cytobacillus firmus TaxID=1399 RepID=A0AA46PPG3_CYTFI|nr:MULTISPECIES: DEAD/DEAH box helicase [Cytobacillus]MCC3648093.1 DEAD/DEAH box helicase [Cytobacillus oceanisediminis]MCS0653808.1 DEAD/DEAH box helicase [Cytobacillus firmus]UYG94965.1 DEAD/DEAH box helicase [Cytobacillus firmus]WHY32682.1 DEAD/DEAH box helicase [Cytobacillus firmus]